MDEVIVRLTAQDLQTFEALVDRALRQSGSELLMPAAALRQKLAQAANAARQRAEARSAAEAGPAPDEGTSP